MVLQLKKANPIVAMVSSSIATCLNWLEVSEYTGTWITSTLPYMLIADRPFQEFFTLTCPSPTKRSIFSFTDCPYAPSYVAAHIWTELSTFKNLAIHFHATFGLPVVISELAAFVSARARSGNDGDCRDQADFHTGLGSWPFGTRQEVNQFMGKRLPCRIG